MQKKSFLIYYFGFLDNRTTFPSPAFRAFPAAPGLGRFPIWLCPEFGLLSESSVQLEQSWRFELTQEVRSTKRKRHIGHLGQLVVCECLYVFFACVRRTLVSIQISTPCPSKPSSSQACHSIHRYLR